PGRGVALDVFDRLEALAHGEVNILDRDVVLEVDERASCETRLSAALRGPRRAGERGACGRGGWRRGGDRFRARPGSGRKAIRELVMPLRGTSRAFLLDRASGDEGVDIRIERKLAARLREQMDRRRPPSGHRDAIAWEHGRAPRAHRFDFDGRDTLAAA